MTREQAQQLRPVYGAYCEGKTVQWRITSEAHWHDYTAARNCSEPWLFFPYQAGIHDVEWRIKPEPREWWLCGYCWRGYNVASRAANCHPDEKRDVIVVKEVLP